MLRLMKQIEELKWIFIVACICFLQSDKLKKEANTEYPPYDPDRHQSCQDMTSQMNVLLKVPNDLLLNPVGATVGISPIDILEG